jgi:hypothetical protein
MDHALAARRLSAALGKRIDPADIAAIHGDLVALKSGEGYTIKPGNGAFAHDPDADGFYRYYRHGKIYEPVPPPPSDPE